MSGGGGPSRKWGPLTKNSVIKCTIDDLRLEEGLLVVSFPHQDNLYQGVLLQLNRERGIPCGISFPNEYFSGEKKDPPEQNVNPLQIPPINQRHTYFQEIDGRQFRSLRRIIKTPARFKNSRMSLRPVQRPVLCAKCGSKCEEKSQSPPPPTPSTNGDHDKSKKTSANNPGNHPTAITKKNTKSTSRSKLLKETPTEEKPKKPDLSVIPPPLISDESSDYNYEGVGSVGIVDNTWKRPLAKPLKYPTRQNLSLMLKRIDDVYEDKRTKPQPQPATTITLRNKRKLMGKTDNRIVSVCNVSSTTGSSSTSSSSSCPVFRITKAPTALKSTDKQKVNNLKLCISKLVLAQKESPKAQLADNNNDEDNNSVKDDSFVWKLASESEASNHSNSENSPMTPTTSADASMKMRIPIRKSKIRLRKRSSAIPYRMRDRGKSGPTWRTRKISTMSNPEETSKCDETDHEVLKELRDGFKEKVSEDEILTKSHHNPKVSPTTSCNNPAANAKCEPPQAGKTPVIKITFGTSGNGMVVQIPPRTTGAEGETENAESKAARKAMKKAKKEAKRKHAVPEDASAIDALSPPPKLLSPLTVHCNVGHGTNPDLYTIKTNSSATEQHSVVVISPVESESGNGTQSLTETSSSNKSTEDPTLEPIITPPHTRTAKKRKKDKKKKRSKDHKEPVVENDQSISGDDDITHIDDCLLNSSKGTLINVPVELSSPTMIKLLEDRPVLIASRRESDRERVKVDENDGEKETPQRVCISLRRLTSNAYVPLNSLNDELEDDNEKETENEEPCHEFSDDSTFMVVDNEESPDGIQSPILSIEEHIQSNHTYRKGDVVWGKSTGCPWWPGRIVDILLKGVDDVRAKIAWYKSAKQSFIAFTDLHPFTEYYEMKYTKNRKRGFYQQAVREAFTDAQQLNSEDLSND